ncbi:methyltransferase domain-containing protein [Candidatus Bathyarchaeota archaeon]|nr:methyltransferase domain-containing protein [Candidatus Bathyarchaeota archaeon]
MSDKEYFEQVARKWDQLRQSFFSEALREKAILAGDVQKGKLAVDVGAGTGFITEGLIQKGLRVIAVDQSEAMLSHMRMRLGDSGLVEFRIGEAERLPVKDESVDYVFANMLLHHVEHPQAAIKEMARILKKGGTLVITDLDEHKFRFLMREQYDRWLGFKRKDMKRWFVEAGFRKTKVESADENCCAQSTCGQESARVSIFVASGRKQSVHRCGDSYRMA